ncbi:hypothetical protein [Streptomyces sp. NPDC046832]|uniref:hypothetical protein n=1 Tax=Streptomyces sp. NPDC046832 TaxID=3155020 RepID=UPI0033EFF122
MPLPEEQWDPRTRERLALAPHEPGGGAPNIFTPHLIEIVMPMGQYRMVAFLLNATGVELESGLPGTGLPEA